MHRRRRDIAFKETLVNRKEVLDMPIISRARTTQFLYDFFRDAKSASLLYFDAAATFRFSRRRHDSSPPRWYTHADYQLA